MRKLIWCGAACCVLGGALGLYISVHSVEESPCDSPPGNLDEVRPAENLPGQLVQTPQAPRSDEAGQAFEPIVVVDDDRQPGLDHLRVIGGQTVRGYETPQSANALRQ